MKFCKDCTHIGHVDTQAVCRRSKPMINTITGEPFYPLCIVERKDSWRSRFRQTNCGSQARHFEPRVTIADLGTLGDR